MSEISRNQRQNSAPQNPLLSASVMGLTFDEFSNRPQLLPAAPSPPSTTPITLPSSSVNNNSPIAVFSTTPSFLIARTGGKCFIVSLFISN